MKSVPDLSDIKNLTSFALGVTQTQEVVDKLVIDLNKITVQVIQAKKVVDKLVIDFNKTAAEVTKINAVLGLK